MNLALAWFGKEWRAQWRLLGAYLALSIASVAIVCWCHPAAHWSRHGTGADALVWFLAIGVAGALLFAAPQLARGEFAPKDDQLLRRLPGALVAASAGKLLFLVLASLLLPLAALLSGEAVLLAIGGPWRDVIVLQEQITRGEWPRGVVAVLSALLLTPWVGAVGTWLPGGRMAVGGTALLLLVPGMGVAFVLSLCRGLEKSLAWEPHVWWLWPTGALVFALSWRGRRGGGCGRSAAHGLCTFGAVIAVPAGWLGSEAWRYHHPDPDQLRDMYVLGVSPDGRYALAQGSAHTEWVVRPTFRIDLATGASEQVLECGPSLAAATLNSTAPNWEAGLRRWWRTVGEDRTRVLDLETGAWRDVACRPQRIELDLPADLRADVAAEVRVRAPYRLSGGRRAWREGDSLAIEMQDGSDATVQLPAELARAIPRACGHGLGLLEGQCVLFDLERRRVVMQRPWEYLDAAWAVRGEWIAETGKGTWGRFDPDAFAATDRSLVLEPRPELQGALCRGLIDDDRLLFARGAGPSRVMEYIAYGPAERRIERVDVPDSGVASLLDIAPFGPDVWGRPWLFERTSHAVHLLALDLATLRIERLPVGAMDGAVARLGTTVITMEGWKEGCQRIVQTDWTTGARQVLYPRHERGHQ